MAEDWARRTANAPKGVVFLGVLGVVLLAWVARLVWQGILGPYWNVFALAAATVAFRRYGFAILTDTKVLALLALSLSAVAALRAQNHTWFVTLTFILLVDAVIVTVFLLLVRPHLPQRWFGRTTIVTREDARTARRLQQLVDADDSSESY